jgi:hypothetical protein
MDLGVLKLSNKINNMQQLDLSEKAEKKEVKYMSREVLKYEILIAQHQQPFLSKESSE